MSDDCDHCWHPTGERLTSDPPKHVETCCHCGEDRHRPLESIAFDADAHGPHLPSKTEPNLATMLPRAEDDDD